jgi:hypothetical protein
MWKRHADAAREHMIRDRVAEHRPRGFGHPAAI